LKDDPAAGLIAKAVVGGLRLAGKGLKKIVGKEEFRVRNSDDIVDEATSSNTRLVNRLKQHGFNADEVERKAKADLAKTRADQKEAKKRNAAAEAAAAERSKMFAKPMFKKEETELDEAKVERKPLTPEQKAKFKKAADRRASMSKAAQAAKPPKPMKQKAYVHPEGEPNNTEKPTPKDNPNENIINQLNKEALEGKNRITFRNGKTHLLPTSIVNKARTLHGNMHPSKKGDFQERLAASLESFQDAVKNPENEAPKPKGKEARLAPPDMRPDFHKRLSDMAAAHNARQKEKAKGK